eukprot:151846_1
MPDNFEFDAINTIATVITILNLFVFIPTIIYGLHLFRKHRDNELILYRNPFAVSLMNLLVITALATERVFVVCADIYQIVAVPSWIMVLCFSLTWDAIVYVKLVEVYYVYFQQQYSLSIANKVWKEQINPDSEDMNASWYISRKNTFGDMACLIKLALIPWTITVFIQALISAFVGDVWVLHMMHLIPICLSLLILHKIVRVEDIYRIRNEVFVAMSCIMVAFSVYIVMFMIRHFDPVEHRLDRVESLVNLVVTDGVALACSVLSTLYPVYLVQKSKQMLNLQMVNTQTQTDLQMLNEIMSNYSLFTRFMSYLVSEFCPEGLLFLVELIQCKHAFQQHNDYSVKIRTKNNESLCVDFTKNPFAPDRNYKTEQQKYFTYLFHDDGVIMTKLGLSQRIVQTGILEGGKNENNLFLQMHDLFDKYIKPQAEFEINISYTVRLKLIQIFGGIADAQSTDTSSGEYHNSQMFNIMDEAAIEIVQLLQFSLSRFVYSDQFNSVSDIHCENNPQIENDTAFKELLNAQKTGIVTYYNSES